MGRSVIVGDQGALDWRADGPVVPDDGVESQQALDDTGPQPGGYPAAVVFQAELVLQGPDDRLDALAQPVREVPGVLLVLAGRADQGQAQLRAGQEILEVVPGEALVRHDHGVMTGPVPARG